MYLKTQNVVPTLSQDQSFKIDTSAYRVGYFKTDTTPTGSTRHHRSNGPSTNWHHWYNRETHLPCIDSLSVLKRGAACSVLKRRTTMVYSMRLPYIARRRDNYRVVLIFCQHRSMSTVGSIMCVTEGNSASQRVTMNMMDGSSSGILILDRGSWTISPPRATFDLLRVHPSEVKRDVPPEQGPHQ